MIPHTAADFGLIALAALVVGFCFAIGNWFGTKLVSKP